MLGGLLGDVAHLRNNRSFLLVSIKILRATTTQATM